jgi:xanthine dehydrogenase YagS FAD-binding subunit
MRDFRYMRASDVADAIAVLNREPEARLVAGGTDLLNLLKGRIETPRVIIDIARLPLTEIEYGPDGLRLGALARMSDVAAAPDVRRDFPAIAESLERSGSPQLRNMATVGGNLLQRTRCPYFRADRELPCNKRRPGSGCAAIFGDDRGAAIFGASPHCVATHPSDLAVALAVFDAAVRLRGAGGERRIPLTQFYRPPGDRPERDTVLGHGEVLVGIDVPAPSAAVRSHYLKIGERMSYGFTLVSAAVAAEVAGGTIRSVRIALGGVAPRPWRLTRGEEALHGIAPTPTALRRAIEPAFAGARSSAHSEHKIELAKRAVVGALLEVAH